MQDTPSLPESPSSGTCHREPKAAKGPETVKEAETETTEIAKFELIAGTRPDAFTATLYRLGHQHVLHIGVSLCGHTQGQTASRVSATCHACHTQHISYHESNTAGPGGSFLLPCERCTFTHNRRAALHWNHTLLTHRSTYTCWANRVPPCATLPVSSRD